MEVWQTRWPPRTRFLIFINYLNLLVLRSWRFPSLLRDRDAPQAPRPFEKRRVGVDGFAGVFEGTPRGRSWAFDVVFGEGGEVAAAETAELLLEAGAEDRDSGGEAAAAGVAVRRRDVGGGAVHQDVFPHDQPVLAIGQARHQRDGQEDGDQSEDGADQAVVLSW